MTIEEMAYHIDRLPQPNGEDVYQQFLDVPAEMQETVDAAVQASLTEHAPELQDLKRRIFQGNPGPYAQHKSGRLNTGYNLKHQVTTTHGRNAMTTTTPTLSEISAMLLHDPELRKAELQRVMAEYLILTQNGFAWYLHSKNERHNELPANPEEAQAYKEARNQLAHQALSDDQCLGVTQSSPLGCKSLQPLRRDSSGAQIPHLLPALHSPHRLELRGQTPGGDPRPSPLRFERGNDSRSSHGERENLPENHIRKAPNERRNVHQRTPDMWRQRSQVGHRMSEEPHSRRNKEANMRPMPGRTLT